MANINTQVHTYNQTSGVPRWFDPVISMLDPSDVPLLGQQTMDGRSVLAKIPVDQKKPEWHDDTLLNQRDALNGSITSAATSVTVDNGQKFQVGSLLKVDDEAMRVTSVSTNTLTVTRAYGDTTAASHADNDVVVGLGLTLAEGSDPEDFRGVDRTERHNFTEIFGPYKIQVSGTQQVVPRWGVPNEFDYQTAKYFKQIGVEIEQAILYGERENDTSNNWRSMGGLTYYITSANGASVDTSTTTLTEAKLLDLLQGIYDNGGRADRVASGSKQKRTISAFNTNITVNVNQGDSRRGVVVDFFDSDFGTTFVVLDRWVRTEDLFVFPRDNIMLATLRPVQFEPLAKTGDSIKGQVLCEKSLIVKAAKHTGRFTALT